jgi:hypothetical protein
MPQLWLGLEATPKPEENKLDIQVEIANSGRDTAYNLDPTRTLRSASNTRLQVVEDVLDLLQCRLEVVGDLLGQ